MKILKLFKQLLTHFDPYGKEHGERVAVLAGRLAVLAGVIKYSQLYKDIQTAAEIHDVGKVGVPEAIRRRTGLYLHNERKAMEEHPVYGADMIQTVINGTINSQVVLFVLDHHENYSGDGYPNKKKGDDISLGGRIIRICDTYDAMTHDRGYRKALTQYEALKEMEAHQIKTEFADPKLLRLFLDMMRPIKYER